MSFRRWLSESSITTTGGLFVSAVPTPNALSSILNFVERYDTRHDLVDDIHCTVLFCKHPLNGYVPPPLDKHDRYKAEGVGVVYWPGHDDEGYIVMLLKSPGLQDLHKAFRDAGLEPTFKEYQPHITLVHPAKEADFKRRIEAMNTALQNDPLPLEFRFGGITPQDKDE